jgi:hypothetical protein
MGAGLWLPLETARAVAEDHGAAAQVREALDAAGLFAFTVNAFPMGGFHAARVKRAVYRPTWAEGARLDYSLLAARALARLLPEGARGSVSTVPVGYKAFGEEGRLDAAAERLVACAEGLRALEGETGHEVALALEPEPLATLETTQEAIAFLTERVFARAGEGGLAEDDLRRFLGVCVDTCHVACQFEDLAGSLADLEAAGVRVVKAQLSAALELRDPGANGSGRQALAGYDEPRYLHQSTARFASGALVRVEDLPDLLTEGGALRDPALGEAEAIRTHFHVPLGWAGGEALTTTRPSLEAGLARLAAATDHLEVETYTFGVLPEEVQAGFDHDVVQMVAEELRWADGALSAAGVTVG